MKLVATFCIQLGTGIILKGTEDGFSYACSLDGFEIVVALRPSEGARSKVRGERNWTCICEELVVSAARDESDPPPAIPVQPGGKRNVSLRSPYFKRLLPEYRRAALVVTNNVITFLRCRLRQPLLRNVDPRAQCFANASWSDAAGAAVESGGYTFVVPRIPGFHGELGVVKLERKHRRPLVAAMTLSKPVPLHEDILADAQAAAFEGNIRRAVLELAIACEVFAKHTFLGATGQQREVVEALEDRGRINVRTLELLDIGGQVLYGQSFRSYAIAAHKDIDHLFRARNKVAHRGAAEFRDDAGILRTVDLKLLAQWWRSVRKLFDWVG